MISIPTAFVVSSPRCTDMPLAVFGHREDAVTYFTDLYPTRHDAADYIREVPSFMDGYLGYQRRSDRRMPWQQ